MFNEYLSRIPHLEYLGTIQNAAVCESGIFVAVDDVNEKTRQEHSAYVDAFAQTHSDLQKISLRTYLGTQNP